MRYDLAIHLNGSPRIRASAVDTQNYAHDSSSLSLGQDSI